MSLLKKITLPLLISSAFYSQFSAAATESYAMDPNHTSVVIAWTHFGFSHPTANVSNITGNIDFDSASVGKSKVDVSIPLNTIDTHVDALTTEFKSAEYFDVAKYPTATFKSTKVVSKGKNKMDVYGDLTIKDITKPVVLHAVLNKQGMHPMVKKQAVGFDATTTFKRSEFKLDKYVPAVSDEVKLTISTEAYAK
ncbi:polyisoprenoid-binding protein [Erwinia endophytica]|uniref:YceI family protein n=1 Tax=Erwinia endophytica TaxID=1563158 RepID=UPI001265FECC|nr:YceI family protein [Erwinia endophytica]KAB8310079.1 polyisoprenoid-binding protein [Erwinia endophytica]